MYQVSVVVEMLQLMKEEHSHYCYSELTPVCTCMYPEALFWFGISHTLEML
jgi:hypothetical protein